MPNRIVRDELLTSERYWSTSPEARNLYLSLLLCADDMGRYPAGNFTLRTKCMAGTVSSERIEKLLLEISDADLVRIYESAGSRFIFVPRFKQRVRYPRSKYPSPPPEISDIVIKKTVLSLTQDGLKTAEREVKRREINPLAQIATAFARFWQVYPKRKSKGDALKAFNQIRPDEQLQEAIITGVERAMKSEDWKKDKGKFIPYPGKWLRARGWEDEMVSDEPENRMVI